MKVSEELKNVKEEAKYQRLHAEMLRGKIEKKDNMIDNLKREIVGLKTVNLDIMEKLEIRTKEKDGLLLGEEAMRGKIKELSEDNGALFKKVCDQEMSIVEKITIINDLEEELNAFKRGDFDIPVQASEGPRYNSEVVQSI